MEEPGWVLVEEPGLKEPGQVLEGKQLLEEQALGKDLWEEEVP